MKKRIISLGLVIFTLGNSLLSANVEASEEPLYSVAEVSNNSVIKDDNININESGNIENNNEEKETDIFEDSDAYIYSDDVSKKAYYEKSDSSDYNYGDWLYYCDYIRLCENEFTPESFTPFEEAVAALRYAIGNGTQEEIDRAYDVLVNALECLVQISIIDITALQDLINIVESASLFDDDGNYSSYYTENSLYLIETALIEAKYIIEIVENKEECLQKQVDDAYNKLNRAFGNLRVSQSTDETIEVDVIIDKDTISFSNIYQVASKSVGNITVNLYYEFCQNEGEYAYDLRIDGTPIIIDYININEQNTLYFTADQLNDMMDEAYLYNSNDMTQNLQITITGSLDLNHDIINVSTKNNSKLITYGGKGESDTKLTAVCVELPDENTGKMSKYIYIEYITGEVLEDYFYLEDGTTMTFYLFKDGQSEFVDITFKLINGKSYIAEHLNTLKLYEMITLAEKKNKKDYTMKSWKTFSKNLKKAKKLVKKIEKPPSNSSSTITQKTVDYVMQQLTESMDALVIKKSKTGA